LIPTPLGEPREKKPSACTFSQGLKAQLANLLLGRGAGARCNEPRSGLYIPRRFSLLLDVLEGGEATSMPGPSLALIGEGLRQKRPFGAMGFCRSMVSRKRL